MIMLRYDSSRNVFGITYCTKSVSMKSETLLAITIPVSILRLKFFLLKCMQALIVYYCLLIVSSFIYSLLSFFQTFLLSISLNTS